MLAITDYAQMSRMERVTPASSEMKTDLKLLLECLKCEMSNPEAQKDTLAAVCSICRDNSEASDYFREIGGFVFVTSLAKSSCHLKLKEVSLYTLGVLADSNVFCQQTLCTLELFEEASAVFSDDQSLDSLKKMAAVLVLMLASNNQKGQTFARESGCIEKLLVLFSSSLTHNTLPDGSPSPQYQLWLCVCRALCVCVNNPQNEENQELCCSAFPQVDKWLQHSIHPDIVRPICSLIGLSVASNRSAQDYFAAVGGLDTLADVLRRLVNGIETKRVNPELAVVVTKTLDACVAQNPRAVNLLSKHGIISNLITLLSDRSLDPQDRFSIILALGHSTEDCEANQYELLKSNGLPLMIQMLAESQDDEIQKGATFVLQNCRNITEAMCLSLSEQTPNIREPSEAGWDQEDKCEDTFWEKAKEIYHKMQHLQPHNEDIVDIEEHNKTMDCSPNCQNEGSRLHAANVISELPCLISQLKQLIDDPGPVSSSKEFLSQSIIQKSQSNCFSTQNRAVSALRESAPLDKARRQIFLDTASARRSAAASSGRPDNIASDSHTAAEQTPADGVHRDQSCRSHSCRNMSASRDVFTQTAAQRVTDNLDSNSPGPQSELMQEDALISPVRSSASRRDSARKSSINGTTDIDPVVLCADLIDKEISSVLDSDVPQSQIRCSGCLVTAHSMDSRNCSRILLNCPHLCDHHRVILQGEERYKAQLRTLLHGSRLASTCNSYSLTPVKKGNQEVQHPDRTLPFTHGVSLTPVKKVHPQARSPGRALPFTQGILLTPRKKPNQGHQHPDRPSHPQALQQPKGSSVRKQETIGGDSGSCRFQIPRRPERTTFQAATRKDFTQKEIGDLLDGVKKFGHHWNAILWSYPFQNGRTNVDLAKKYKHLQMQQADVKNVE
ncbi:telomere repeats-binding bouquet formation protein 1 isoform X4 [Hyperolius riggenbachi]|uniref:telomere repeats-binding bouquet formation protein 1 isoform X4 n=1 Tax=Hyperolius riggenbachi TaxID=752182 RepID=UPI0035A3B12E